MKKTILVLLGILISQGYCMAQVQEKIFGHVTDSATSEPVEFANVMLLRADSTFVCGAVTDSLGYYEFLSRNSEQGENYFIQATHTCYEKELISFLPEQKPEVDLSLKRNNMALDDVLVTAIRTKVKNRLNFKYTFTEQMRNKVKLTSRLLENVPTVFVDCNSNVHIKGSSNILILKNGIELTDNALVDQIRPESVKNVEILFHIPSKYANLNYTAIMNIVTEKEQGYSLMVDSKTSVDATMNDTKVNLGYAAGKSSIYFFYKQYYRNLRQKNQNRIMSDEGVLLSKDLYTTSPRKECDNEFFYGYSYQPNSKFQLGIDGYYSFYRERFQNEFGGRTLYSVQKEKFNTQNYKGYVDYNDGKRHLKLELSLNKKKINDNDDYHIDDLLVHQYENQDIYNVKLDYTHKFGESATLYGGVKYSHSRDRVSYNNSLSDLGEKYDCNNTFAYAEWMKSFGESWIVDAGISFQNYHRSFHNGINVKETDVFPKFNISYTWGESNLALGYSSYLNEPGIWQMLPFRKKESVSISTQGNPYLKPEKHGNLSLEYSYSKGDFYFATSAYFKQTDNQTGSHIQTEDGKNSLIAFRNINKVKDAGFDLTISCSLAKWWSISFYGDAVNRHIGSNCYYRKNLLSCMAQIQSSWTLSPRLYAILQYTYNSRELQSEGYLKSRDSSIGLLNYSLNDHFDLYMVLIQPFGNLKQHTRIYHVSNSIDMRDEINSQKVMLCLTFNLSKGKKLRKQTVYENESKKY